MSLTLLAPSTPKAPKNGSANTSPAIRLATGRFWGWRWGVSGNSSDCCKADGNIFGKRHWSRNFSYNRSLPTGATFSSTGSRNTACCCEHDRATRTPKPLRGSRGARRTPSPTAPAPPARHRRAEARPSPMRLEFHSSCH